MKPQTLRQKTLDEYYRHLKDLQSKAITNEEGLRPAFQSLLITLGREQGWTLVPEVRLANGSKPDGTFVDANILHRGFWEAKDTKDDLENEIKKKIARGYPLTNIIFEDTKRAVLYQQGKRVLEVPDLAQPQWLTDLLTQFFSYTEPAIAEFEQAVEEFQGRIPDLAKGLLALITQECAGNKRFQAGAVHLLEGLTAPEANGRLRYRAHIPVVHQRLQRSRAVTLDFALQELPCYLAVGHLSFARRRPRNVTHPN